MIPKIIHYCWFSKDKNKELPIAVRRSIESWKRILPDYEIRLWNEETFDINSVPWVKECYDCGCASYAYMADYVRFWALYNYGGIYMDADQMVTKSLDQFLDNKMFVGMINPNEIGWCLIGAEKENPTIKALLDSYNRPYINKDNSINCVNINYTGSSTLRKLYNFNPDVNLLQKFDGLTIYPKMYFYPVNEFSINKDTHAIHLGMTSHYKMISVVMSVYNGEKYLRECIDSVLAQTFTDFEFIIVDDGSTDNTENIIKSYTDDRIVYIKKKHEGISEALNLGIRRAIGIYIARMDADDKMYPNRLAIQYKVMQEHPEYDMITAGFEWGNGKPIKEYFSNRDFNITVDFFKHGANCIAHPTVMMRTRSLRSLPFIYEKMYDGCEDLKLWHTMLTHGLKIHNIPDIVNYYRQHPDQCTNNSRKYYNSFDYAVDQSIVRAYNKKNNSDAKLTVIIPFQNEGPEVEKTVTSVRATANNVNIMLINDNSNDIYDYKRVADIFGCSYYQNLVNLGVAGSRDFGVAHCDTPYFVLLDAHMRFYSLNWDDELVKLLEENPNRLITSNTIYFSKDRYGIYNNEDGCIGRHKFGTYAASVNLTEPGWEYTAKWTSKIIDPDKRIVPISCVLGAVYSSSVSWWNNIGGLKGLVKYGLDEPLMSIKTWLAGGEVLLIKDWGVGHLYRGRGNYPVSTVQVDRNQLYLIHLFSSDDKIPIYEENLKKRVGDKNFEAAKELLMKDYNELMEFKKHFFNNVAKYNLNHFIEINNKVYC